MPYDRRLGGGAEGEGEKEEGKATRGDCFFVALLAILFATLFVRLMLVIFLVILLVIFLVVLSPL